MTDFKPPNTHRPPATQLHRLQDSLTRGFATMTSQHPATFDEIPGQLTIFGDVVTPTDPPYPKRGVRPTGPDTSKLAAVPHPGRSRLAWTILALFGEVNAGGGSFADHTLHRLLPSEHPGSVTKRRTDLLQLGLVEDSGARVQTPDGRMAICWRITPTGMYALRAVDMDYS